MSERDELIAEIMGTMHRMQHLLVADRSSPLLNSTLTMQQLQVLLVLSLEPDGCSGQELATTMGVSLATMTGIVDRLVASGLVDRREDQHDRRVRRVRLTEAGRDTIEGIVSAGEATTAEILRRLGEDDLRVVARAMLLLWDAAAAHLGVDHLAR